MIDHGSMPSLDDNTNIVLLAANSLFICGNLFACVCKIHLHHSSLKLTKSSQLTVMITETKSQ